MKSGRQVALAIIATIGGWATSAHAQKEQTVETAQEFLAATAPKLLIRILPEKERHVRDASFVVSMAAGATDSCVTDTAYQIDYDYADAAGQSWTTTGKSSGQLNWARYVVSVSRVGSKVSVLNNYRGDSKTTVTNPDGSKVSFPTPNTTYVFEYPTEQLATRAAYAMEFIRIECDPTADLAF